MIWASPLAFLLFLPWTAASWRVLRTARRRAVPFAPLARLPRKSTWRQHARTVLPFLFLAGLAALILAAARPQSFSSLTRRTTDAVAIQMVLDVSGSMDALDFSTRRGSDWDFKTRLDVVKEAFAEFVERRPEDLIGLITFGGFAVTRAPLTLDHPAMLHLLSSVEIPRMEDGAMDREELLTAIGDGLAMACARLQQATNVTSRIIVLLSDGESNAGVVTPEEGTQLARKLGIRVYCIGAGTDGVAPFRGRDLFGREVITQVHVTMDEEELKRIAEETGGLYFSVTDREGLDHAMKQIDELEKTSVAQAVYEERTDHFGPWLLVGLLLLFLAISLNMTLEQRIV